MMSKKALKNMELVNSSRRIIEEVVRNSKNLRSLSRSLIRVRCNLHKNMVLPYSYALKRTTFFIEDDGKVTIDHFWEDSEESIKELTKEWKYIYIDERSPYEYLINVVWEEEHFCATNICPICLDIYDEDEIKDLFLEYPDGWIEDRAISGKEDILRMARPYIRLKGVDY